MAAEGTQSTPSAIDEIFVRKCAACLHPKGFLLFVQGLVMDFPKP
jgi:hypothetical protein